MTRKANLLHKKFNMLTVVSETESIQTTIEKAFTEPVGGKRS